MQCDQRRSHETMCGSVLLLLELESSMVKVLKFPHYATWGSVYLDQHGEEDPGLRRLARGRRGGGGASSIF